MLKFLYSPKWKDKVNFIEGHINIKIIISIAISM
jgi:hypothetical protein